MGTTVVIAEDAFIVREGIRMLLEEAGYEINAAVETFDELLEAVSEHSPDIVITDIRMPPTRTDEGVRAAREIREKHPGTGVVVLSQYVEPEYATKLFEAGTDGHSRRSRPGITARRPDEPNAGGRSARERLLRILQRSR